MKENDKHRKRFNLEFNVPLYYNKELADWARDKKDLNYKYSYNSNPCTHDFTREMYGPGEHDKYPDGVIFIRTDDNFFIDAAIPWKFKDVPIIPIVYTLWTDIVVNYKCEFHYDVGPSAQIDLHGQYKKVAKEAERAQRCLSRLSEALESLQAMAQAAGKDISLFMPVLSVEGLDELLEGISETKKDDNDD